MLQTSHINDLINLLYPKECLGCQQPLLTGEELICTGCMTALPRTNFHRHADNEVSRNFTGRCRLEKATSYLYFAKTGLVQRLMHAFKYKGQAAIGSLMGRIMGRDLWRAGFLSGIDFLIPVPLHEQKIASRGYNQSEILAQGVSERSGIPVMTHNLVRQSFSETQTRKSRFARWQNVEHIFALQKPEEVENAHLMLVDDVITTGSTIEARATQLEAVTGTRVSLLTLAVAKN
ncbi:MAG: phosphoribosyltransferase family protein [Owenweeksia sp.]|nr:phosphoribosyltransferase family protein [Owenweeksia sp.]